MTNSVNYPNQPYPANYSGVTIHITNPTVNANPNGTTVSGGCIPAQNVNYPTGQYVTVPSTQQNYYQIPQTYTPSQPVYQNYSPYPAQINQPASTDLNSLQQPAQGYYTQPQPVNNQTESPAVINSYPPQYYMNNYTYNAIPQENILQAQETSSKKESDANTDVKKIPNTTPEENTAGSEQGNLSLAASGSEETKEEDLSTSKNIIENLDTLSAEEKEIKKTSEQKKVVALTNEYIMSLENYLNNPNLDIRLMAAKEILTRLDEDRNRYDDAALNALLNKMLQDPDDLIRIAALSAFNSELASGNDYTVTLLTKIQQNPEANKDDVLQASEILLKMSAETDTKYMPTQTSTVEIKTTKTKGE